MSEDKVTTAAPSLIQPPAQEVRDLILFLDKAVKAVKMYPPNNPQHQMFVGRAVGKFLEFFGVHPALRLAIGRSDITAGPDLVYQNDDRASSLAFALYKDGVRELIFAGSVEEREVKGLIQAFNRDFTKEYLDEDLVTYFWEQDFKHIRYVATEDYMDEFLPKELQGAADRDRFFLEKAGMGGVRHSDLRGMIAGLPAAGGAPGGRGAPLRQAHLGVEALAVSDEEKVRLDKLVKDDASAPVFPVLVELLLSILRQERNKQSLADILALMRRIVEHEAVTGRFRSAANSLGKITAIALAREEPSALAAGEARSTLVRFGDKDFIEGALVGAITAHGEHDPEGLEAFIRAMPRTAAKPLLGLFEKVESLKMRKVLCRALAALVRSDVGAIIDGLDDDRWYVVRNTVYVLSMTGEEHVLVFLRKAMSHPDARVRREVIKAVFGFDKADIDDYVTLALDDHDEKLRHLVLKSIGRRQGEPVRAKTAAMVAASSFRRRSDEERRLLLHALGRIGAVADLDAFEKILAKRFWLENERRREKMWIIEALGQSDSPRARQILGRMAVEGPRAIRETCRKALRSRPPAVAASAEEAPE